MGSPARDGRFLDQFQTARWHACFCGTLGGHALCPRRHRYIVAILCRGRARRPSGAATSGSEDWACAYSPTQTNRYGRRGRVAGRAIRTLDTQHRSEEHTSELQSLMRISYAVLCLKNKNNIILLT